MPSDPNSNLFLNELQVVADSDCDALERAQKNYGNSWKNRGGVGAFMMLARKWDRLEKLLSAGVEGVRSKYDIFEAIETDKRAEGVIDDIRDLRRYLMLVEAEAIAMGFCPGKLAKDQEAGTASKGGARTLLCGASKSPDPVLHYDVLLANRLSVFQEDVEHNLGRSLLVESIRCAVSDGTKHLYLIHPTPLCKILRNIAQEAAGGRIHDEAMELEKLVAEQDNGQPTASQLHPL